MSSTKPILGYYNLRGWVGPIRFLLAYMEVDYEDKQYPMPTPETGQGLWGEEKFKLGLDFPNIPYWIDGDFKITESKAILKHVVRMYDPSLFGKTIEEQSRANMIEDVMWDLFVALTRTCMLYTDALRESFASDTPTKLKQLSDYIGSKNWTLGEDLTYVDFLVYEVLYQVGVYDNELLNPFPNLKNFNKAFEELPAIQKYMSSPTFVKGPCYSIKVQRLLHIRYVYPTNVKLYLRRVHGYSLLPGKEVSSPSLSPSLTTDNNDYSQRLI